MPVGSGSIKRAAKAAGAAKETAAKEAVQTKKAEAAAQETEVQKTVQTKKTALKKEGTRTARTAEGKKNDGEGKGAEQKIYGITDELPVYLL